MPEDVQAHHSVLVDVTGRVVLGNPNYPIGQAGIAALIALILGVLLARRLTRPQENRFNHGDAGGALKRPAFRAAGG